MWRAILTVAVVMAMFFVASPVLAFEIGGVVLSNTVRYLPVISDDTDTYDARLDYFLLIKKKEFPVWFSNLYQRDMTYTGKVNNGPGETGDQWQMRTAVGYTVNDNLALMVERHEWSFKRSDADDIVYRAGVELKF